MHKYKKRLSTSLIFFVLISSVLLMTGFGCVERPPEPQEVTLTIWNLWDDDDVYQEIIDKFTEKYPHIRIVYEKKELDPKLTGYETGYESSIVNALAEGSGPDIFAFNNNWLPKYKGKLVQAPDPLFSGKTSLQLTLNNHADAKEWIVPFADENGNALENGRSYVQYPDNYQSDVQRVYESVDSAFVDAVSEGLVDHDGVWGVTPYVDSLALFYNRDLLNSSGVPYAPVDWVDFQEAVRKTVRTESGKIVQAGAAIGTDKKISRSADLLSVLMMQQCGSRECMVNENLTEVRFNRELDVNGQVFVPGQRAMEYYTTFSNISQAAYSWAPDIFNSDGYENEIEAFSAGKVGMIFNYYSAVDEIREKNANLNFDVAPLPQVNQNVKVNYSNYWALGVSRTSAYPLEAWAFLDFLVQEENARTYQQKSGNPPSLRKLVAEFNGDEIINVFANQTLTARNWYKIDAAKVDEIMNSMISDVVISNLIIEDAMNNRTREINELMK